MWGYKVTNQGQYHVQGHQPNNKSLKLHHINLKPKFILALLDELKSLTLIHAKCFLHGEEGLGGRQLKSIPAIQLNIMKSILCEGLGFYHFICFFFFLNLKDEVNMDY